MDKNSMIHVSIVNLEEKVAEKGIDILYQPLSRALAPLGMYLVPIIQDANYLNKIKYNGEMGVKDFLSLTNSVIERLKLLDIYILIEYINEDNIEVINVYTDEKTFKDSTYANEGFVKNVYRSELPVTFKYEVK